MLRLLKVSGNSLLPTYRDGDFVLISKIPYLFGLIRPGDVIAFRHKTYGTMIKQVESTTSDNDQIFVIGTGENSVDSRSFGTISKDDVMGRVIWHIGKPMQ